MSFHKVYEAAVFLEGYGEPAKAGAMNLNSIIPKSNQDDLVKNYFLNSRDNKTDADDAKVHKLFYEPEKGNGGVDRDKPEVPFQVIQYDWFRQGPLITINDKRILVNSDDRNKYAVEVEGKFKFKDIMSLRKFIEDKMLGSTDEHLKKGLSLYIAANFYQAGLINPVKFELNKKMIKKISETGDTELAATLNGQNFLIDKINFVSVKNGIEIITETRCMNIDDCATRAYENAMKEGKTPPPNTVKPECYMKSKSKISVTAPEDLTKEIKPIAVEIRLDIYNKKADHFIASLPEIKRNRWAEMKDWYQNLSTLWKIAVGS